MSGGLRFVHADRPETCHDCGEPIPIDALMMPRYIREPQGYCIGSMTRRRVVECHACGLLLLESQDHPII
jgi:hypothetical protein